MIERDDWRLLNDVEFLKNKEINPTDGEEIKNHVPYLKKCQIIKDGDVSDRSHLIELLLQEPKSDVQKAALTECLADKESYARDRAIEIARKTTFNPENYLKMEEMLRYKAADLRSNLIELLYGQEDFALQATVERLLADKKEEKRTAGLDIVMQLANDKKRKALFDDCRKYVSNLQETTDKEQILIDNILGNQEEFSPNQKAEALFDKEKDKYIPAIEVTDNFARAFSVFEQYFPATSIGEDTNSNGGNPTASVLADCEDLHKLFLMHVNDEYRGYGNEVHTIGEQVSNFREYIDDFTFETPLLSVWKGLV